MRVISRPLGPNHSPPTFVPTKQGTKTLIISSQFSMPSKSVPNSRFSTKDEDMMMDGRYGRGFENRIGSRPPSCEHKCYGCSPCEATQVPTTSHVGIQYTNYEPEGRRVAVKYHTDEWPTNGAKLAFERSIFNKTNTRTEAEIVMFDNNVVVYKLIQDLHFFVTGGDYENELALAMVLQRFSEADALLLREALENLDTVFLCLDEIVDAG
ncbi:hypothetical protein L1987_87884 [Smallanthus sonchifolius]|nr:hypothetical protein L1987_87884 [Smallanthus sonchifolius]